MKKITISTTNAIEGAEIQKYIDIVFSNVVIGTNIISDIGASFTDFFGGTSGIYKGKLEKMRELAISEIKEKARNLGANAIIGMKIDFDEISGKGKSMFMISLSGTAVKVNYKDSLQTRNGNNNDLLFSFDQIHSETVKRIVLSQIDKNRPPTEEQWDVLINNPLHEITIKLLPLYLSVINKPESQLYGNDLLLNSNYYSLIKRGDNELIANFLYCELLNTEYTEQIVKIINDNQLFYPDKIKQLLDNSRFRTAILCLPVKKEFYTYEDLIQMKQILVILDNLPETGKIEKMKSGLMSKEKEMYICENGHKNSIDQKFCLVEKCRIDIKGLTNEDYRMIELLRSRIISLEYLFNKSKKEDN
jgi:uncharacterized protein YbjQ (UPF0145 family)